MLVNFEKMIDNAGKVCVYWTRNKKEREVTTMMKNNNRTMIQQNQNRVIASDHTVPVP